MQSKQQCMTTNQWGDLAVAQAQAREKWEIRLVLLVFGVAAFLLFFRLGAGSLHSWTEAIYAQIGQFSLLLLPRARLSLLLCQAGKWVLLRMEGEGRGKVTEHPQTQAHEENESPAQDGKLHDPSSREPRT